MSVKMKKNSSKPSFSRRTRCSSSLYHLAFLWTFLLSSSSSSPSKRMPQVLWWLPSLLLADAKEVVATKEWQLLGEDDTIPAGMHVRMDLSTGEKWVKLPDDNDENDKDHNDHTNINTEHVIISREKEETTKSAVAVTINPDGSFEMPGAEDSTKDKDDHTATSSHGSGYDYEMMHRTLSKLPQEEMDKYGGLPELPSGAGTNNNKSTMTAEERSHFQTRMAEIWEKRQAELKEAQEQLLDVPELLKDRMRGMKEYLKDPLGQLNSFNLEDEDTDEEEGIITNILSLLKDLEYQLTDLDNARDFHTMGGWELLVTFLSEEAHVQNTTTTSISTLPQPMKDKIRFLQSYAAWTIGTAVKNTEEFFPYAIEPVKLKGGKTTTTTTTALDMMLDVFCKEYDEEEKKTKSVRTLQAKSIYAIGSLLRGNRIAQRHLVNNKGGIRLGDTLQKLVQKEQHQQRPGDIKLVQRLLSLASDSITDIQLDGDVTTPELNESILRTFTTPQWCDVVSGILTTTETLLQVPVRIQETVLEASITMASHCSDWAERSEDHKSALRSLWNRWEENEDDFDIEHLNQLKKQATQLRNLL